MNVRGRKLTFRHLSLMVVEFEFSDGFTDLHTTPYREIVAGRGFGVDDCQPCVAIVERLRDAATFPARDDSIHSSLLILKGLR